MGQGAFIFCRRTKYELPEMRKRDAARLDAHAEIPLVELGPLDDDDTSMFTRDPFPEFPDAELCRKCGLVVFPCKMIEKKAEK